MLRHRVNADDDVRTPFFKLLSDVADAAAVKKFAGFRAKTIYRPVNVFHPMLAIAQNPIVNIDQFPRKLMRFFGGFDDANGDGFPFPKFIQTFAQSLRRRAMTAACVG